MYEGDIPDKMYDIAVESMRNKILFSTVNVFKKMPFYKILTPKLQSEVIKEVLKKEFKKIMYYVCDFNS